MAFFDWNKELIVDNGIIDAQHKRLIELVNTLFDAMSEGKGNDALGEVFIGLVDYTKSHFSTEAALMKLHNYPDLVLHLKEHEVLTKQVLDLHDKFKENETTLSLPVLNFLRNWLNQHILSSDKKFGDYLLAKQINLL